jgi:hypothetical protein
MGDGLALWRVQLCEKVHEGDSGLMNSPDGAMRALVGMIASMRS